MSVVKTIIHNFGLNTGYSELDSSSIDFPVKRNILGQKKMIDVPVEFFRIESIVYSPYLEIDQSNLLKIKFLGVVDKEGQDIRNFHLTAFNNPYQILINHNAILDCIDLEQNSANISFKVSFSINGEVISKDYAVTISLAKAKPNCVVEFEPQEDIKYTHDNILAGVLHIENTCEYRYAELAAVNLNVKYPLEFADDIVSLGQIKEIVEDEPYYENAGLREEYEDPISILKISRQSNQQLELKRITAQNRISVPVYLDLERLVNPEEEYRDEKFVLVIKNILNDVTEAPIDYRIRIHRDFTRTRLFVKCNNLNVDNNTRNSYGHYNWIHHQTGRKERFAGVMRIANIQIGNEATNEGLSKDSAIIIKNIKLYPLYKELEIASNAEFLDEKSIEDETYVLKNGVNSYISYSCKLLHKNISDIPYNLSKITFNIEFDYIEDENGNYGLEEMVWSHFKAEAVVEVEKDPGSEWLCVDYGTSATVAVFGDGTDNNFQLLKLNNRNKEIIEERENERFRTPRFENGEHFLSSIIMLQPNIPALDANSREKSLVYLSPSEPRFHARGFRLPYMKALVGYKNLPNGDNYAQFEYKVHESDIEHVSFEDRPLEVDTIFRSTYRSLFRDYISTCIPKGKEVNKIVLTVPNTYTPHHIEYLRKIVKAEIPSLRDDYIWFVSESDSIAYYYLKNWAHFNKDRNESYDGKVEHVLVYDMGAGTLDLTYLSIEHSESGDKKVTMLSKLGLNKAGNYLDYVLAEVLVDVYPGKFPKAILSHSDDDTMQNLLGKLKFFITNELKPNLFNSELDSITFSAWNGQTIMGQDFENERIDLTSIRSNKIIKDFIDECTDMLFERFAKIGDLIPDESPIDTLIMTGRSIQFGDIKRRLQHKIDIWNDDNHCATLEINGDKLKTIVSQGALYYATLYGKRTSSVVLCNRNIYAKYGVLYEDRKNRWTYQPLIDSKTKSIRRSVAETGQQNGMQIYSYDTDCFSADETTNDICLDMRNTVEAYLVQCYSPDPAKDFEDEERRNDYISVMAAFSPESVCQDKRKVHLRLVVDENNEMIFTAGDMEFEASAPIKIDVETNQTFKHSMWPYA
jgi:hypothetical protein